MRQTPIGPSCGTGFGGWKAVEEIEAGVMASPRCREIGADLYLGCAARHGQTETETPLPRASKRRALPDRRGQRAFVEIVEFAADRNAMREAGDLDGIGAEQIGDVMGRRLSVD